MLGLLISQQTRILSLIARNMHLVLAQEQNLPNYRQIPIFWPSINTPAIVPF